jgi:hypothetical protein
MNFPAVNGVEEGSLVITGLSFWTAYTGNAYWREPVILPYFGTMIKSHAGIIVLIGLLYPWAFFELSKIFTTSMENKYFKKMWSARYCAMQIIFFWTSIATYTAMMFVSTTQIYIEYNRMCQLGFCF